MSASGKLLIFSWLLISAVARAENSCYMVAPSYQPGYQDTFNAQLTTGTFSYAEGSAYYGYSGVNRYMLSAGSGNYATRIGQERFGISPGNFQIYQGIITPNFFTVVSSNSGFCSSEDNVAQNFNWILVRARTPDITSTNPGQGPMDASDPAFTVGGIFSYDPSLGAAFESSSGLSGTGYFNFTGAVNTSTYQLVKSASGSCMNGAMKLIANPAPTLPSNGILDAKGTAYFDKERFVYVGSGGNPAVALGAKAETLDASKLTTIAKHGFSGIYTEFLSATTQTRKSFVVLPTVVSNGIPASEVTGVPTIVGNGTEFHFYELPPSLLSDAYSDPSLAIASANHRGKFICPSGSLNTPASGFCKGSLYLDAEGSGRTAAPAICLFSTSPSYLMACMMGKPGSAANNSLPVSLVATVPNRSVLAVSMSSTYAGCPSINGCTGAGAPSSVYLTATIKNLTGREATSLGNPANPVDQLSSPFRYKGGGSYPGAGGSCGSRLKGFSSCTVTLEYLPTIADYVTGVGASIQNYKISYFNGVATVNAVATLTGLTGATELVVTGPSAYTQGTNPTLRVLAYYGATKAYQDVTAAATWRYSDSSFTANTTLGSTTLTSVSSVAGLAVGMTLTGPGIASGTTITSIGATTVDISLAATATASGVTFYTGGTLMRIDSDSQASFLGSGSEFLSACLGGFDPSSSGSCLGLGSAPRTIQIRNYGGAFSQIRLGQKDFTSSTLNDTYFAGCAAGNPCPKSLGTVYHLHSDGSRMAVADVENNRVLIWNAPPASSETAADRVLGQATMTTKASGTSSTALSNPWSVWIGDVTVNGAISKKIVVGDQANHRVLIWNSIPASDGAPADIVLGQNDMNCNQSNAAAAGCSAGTVAQNNFSFSSTYGPGVASDGKRLFVADSGNHRVLVWNTFPTANRALPDVVLGQADFTSNSANRGTNLSANTLFSPNVVHSDGTRLVVGDYQNFRVLVWKDINALKLTNGAPADVVLGQPNFISGGNGICQPWGLVGVRAIHTDGKRLFLGDNARVLIYNGLESLSTGMEASQVIAAPNFTTCTGNYNRGPGATGSDGVNLVTGIFSDGTDRIYVADRLNRRVVTFSTSPPEGSPFASLSFETESSCTPGSPGYPNCHNYGTVIPGSEKDHLFQITNDGNTAATYLSPTISGGGSPFNYKGGSYPGIGGTCSGTAGQASAVLLPHQSCLLNVVFSPPSNATLGTSYSQTISVDYQDGSGAATPTVETLNGLTDKAVLKILDGTTDVSSGTFDYGTATTNWPVDKVFTLKNFSSNIIASNLQVSPAASLAAPFAFKGGYYPGLGGTCTSSINPGATCTIVVTFTPTAAQTYAGAGATLALAYFDGSANKVIDTALTGTGSDSASAALNATGFTATPLTASSIRLSWVAPSPIGSTVSYRVAYQTGSAPGNCTTGTVLYYIGSALSWTVTGLAPATPYYFHLCSINSAGTASSGVPVSASTSALPANVGSVSIPAKNSTSAIVTWPAAADSAVVGYVIAYGTSAPAASCAPGSGYFVSALGNVLQIALTELTDSLSYYIRVCSVDAAGNLSTGTTPAEPLIPPHQPDNAGDFSSGVVGNISNQTVSGVASTSALAVGDVVTGGGIVDGTTVQSIANGTSFVLSKSSGTSSNTSIHLVSGNAIALRWTAPTGAGGTAVGYRLAYTQGNTAPAYCADLPGVTLIDVGNVLAYRVTNLSAGTPYSFRLCSYSSPYDTSNGLSVDASSGVPLTVSTSQGFTSNPTGLTADTPTTAQAVSLTWAAPSPAPVGYKISYWAYPGYDLPTGCAAGPGISVLDVGSATSKTDWVMPSALTQYQFRVCAYGTGVDASSGVLVRTYSGPASASKTTTSVTLGWPSDPAKAGYKIYFKSGTLSLADASSLNDLCAHDYLITAPTANTTGEYRITVGGVAFVYTVNNTKPSASTIAAALVSAINDASTGSALVSASNPSTGLLKLKPKVAGNYTVSTSYTVTQGGSIAAQSTLLDVGNVTSFTKTGLSGSYAFRVCSYEAGFTNFIASGGRYAAQTGGSSAVEIPSASASPVSSKTAQVSWTNGSGLGSSYRIAYVNASSAPATCANYTMTPTGYKSTSYNVTIEGTTYTWTSGTSAPTGTAVVDSLAAAINNANGGLGNASAKAVAAGAALQLVPKLSANFSASATTTGSCTNCFQTSAATIVDNAISPQIFSTSFSGTLHGRVCTKSHSSLDADLSAGTPISGSILVP